MNGEQRRAYILERLEGAKQPVTASALASELSVSRQIIVSDIALLRATGIGIIAERRGYYLEKKGTKGLRRSIVCRHTTEEDTKNELYCLVDFGCNVLNVIVDHPVYGPITADLGFTSRFDVDAYMQKSRELGAAQLSALTDGTHIHTVIAPNETIYTCACDKLRAMGVLVECVEE